MTLANGLESNSPCCRNRNQPALRLTRTSNAPPSDTTGRYGKWWSQGGSNPRPQRCERCALPTELWPRKILLWDVRPNCSLLIDSWFGSVNRRWVPRSSKRIVTSLEVDARSCEAFQIQPNFRPQVHGRSGLDENLYWEALNQKAEAYGNPQTKDGGGVYKDF